MIKRLDDWVMASRTRFIIAALVLQAIFWAVLFHAVDVIFGK